MLSNVLCLTWASVGWLEVLINAGQLVEWYPMERGGLLVGEGALCGVKICIWKACGVGKCVGVVRSGFVGVIKVWDEPCQELWIDGVIVQCHGGKKGLAHIILEDG